MSTAPETSVAPCSCCGLAVNDPPQMPPPDAQGRCAACAQMRSPGYLERIAANGMPACFTPTRSAFVRLAVLCIEMRGGTRQ